MQEGTPVTRVLVVDDHSFFRSCLVEMINASGDLLVVGECADGAQVESAVSQLQPDVVVMDLRMPQMSGLDAAAHLQKAQVRARIIMLTSDTTESSRSAARAYGVAAYLCKDTSACLMVDTIRRTAEGQDVWSESLAM